MAISKPGFFWSRSFIVLALERGKGIQMHKSHQQNLYRLANFLKKEVKLLRYFFLHELTEK